MTIYTRHGDKAFTTTFDGERTEKTSPTIAAYGDVDELKAHLGLLRAMTTELQKSADNATGRDTIDLENQYIEHLQRPLLPGIVIVWMNLNAQICLGINNLDQQREHIPLRITKQFSVLLPQIR